MTDTEDAPYTCDVCQLPVLDGDETYTATTDHVLRTTRHYSCHQRKLDEFEAARAGLPELLERSHRIIADLRRRGL